jgi:hypothetical protein
VNRQVWAAITIKPNKALMQQLVSIFITAVESIKHVKGVLPSIVFQAINEDEIQHMSKNGGNCLGIKKGDGPLLGMLSLRIVVVWVLQRWLMMCAVFSFTIRYSLASDDHAIHAAGASIISQSTLLAKEMNLHHPYIYQNYANVSQDVFAGYGPANHRKLKEIAGAWDPEGVFGRRLQPGYFKL